MKTASVQAMAKLSHTVEASALERSLLELVKIRASQINGCAYCLDMDTKDATNAVHRRTAPLTFEVVVINGWNRLAISMRALAGTPTSRIKAVA